MLPEISISHAPSQEHQAEPYSPFGESFTKVKQNPDAYRPALLTPPPGSIPKTLSPLRPVDTVNEGTGMQRERFESLLKASRLRQSAVPAKKDNGLLREISLKAHKNKQIERRALFLSKVLAPPSPTATCTPKTPPESPAIFHYSLPSPGLSSPLSHFESLDTLESAAPKQYWVEQVDFKMPSKPVERKVAAVYTPATKASRHLPSLAQISAHLHTRSAAESAVENVGSRLPAFLTKNAHGRSPTPPGVRPRLLANVGRLSMPIRVPQPTKAASNMLPPATPTSPLTPKLQVTTMLVPRTSTTSPTQLTETVLRSLESREHRAKTMISTIRKRQPVQSERVLTGNDSDYEQSKRMVLTKRRSAPGDLASARNMIWGNAPAHGGF